MKTLSLVLASSLLMAAASAPVSLVQNEYDFAAAVAKQGVRDGFLQFLDKQAIGFSPTPANAYDDYTKSKPGGSGKLTWYPAYAVLASSGDFGVDTGPWAYEGVGKDGKTQRAYGDWLTVWHRGKDGQWKALFDGGIDHAAASDEKALAHDAQVPEMKPAGGPVLTADAVQDQLVQADSAFSNEASDHSLREAYRTSGSTALRLMLDKSLPVLGRDLAVKVAPDVSSGLIWEPMGGSAAKSGDLGYVYGETYRLSDAKKATPVGVYMHVWRREADGWKLLIAEDTPL
jgi:ketosteroid isomerase-like protein